PERSCFGRGTSHHRHHHACRRRHAGVVVPGREGRSRPTGPALSTYAWNSYLHWRKSCESDEDVNPSGHMMFRVGKKIARDNVAGRKVIPGAKIYGFWLDGRTTRGCGLSPGFPVGEVFGVSTGFGVHPCGCGATKSVGLSLVVVSIEVTSQVISSPLTC